MTGPLDECGFRRAIYRYLVTPDQRTGVAVDKVQNQNIEPGLSVHRQHGIEDIW